MLDLFLGYVILENFVIYKTICVSTYKIRIFNNDMILFLQLILEEYYASECICKNEGFCDGTAFTDKKPRVCTAYMRGGLTTPTVVRLHSSCIRE